MLLAVIEPEYNWQEKVTDHNVVRAAFPDWYKEAEDHPLGWEPKSAWNLEDRIIDQEQLEQLVGFGIEVKIKRLRGLNPRTLNADGSMALGEHHYHLPNDSLHQLNKVDYEEDCCTDALQKRLDDGWRIIAVCPPLDKRRPDYILGRNSNES